MRIMDEQSRALVRRMVSAWIGYMTVWAGELGQRKGWVKVGQASWVYGGMCRRHGSAEWADES